MLVTYTVARRTSPGPRFLEDRKILEIGVTNNKNGEVPPEYFDQMLYLKYTNCWGNSRDELVSMGGCRDSLAFIDDDVAIVTLCWVDHEKGIGYATNPTAHRTAYAKIRNTMLAKFGYEYDPNWFGFVLPVDMGTYDLTIENIQSFGSKL